MAAKPSNPKGVITRPRDSELGDVVGPARRGRAPTPEEEAEARGPEKKRPNKERQ